MHPFSILTLGIFVAGYITARWDLVTRLYELAIFAWDHGVVVRLSGRRDHPSASTWRVFMFVYLPLAMDADSDFERVSLPLSVLLHSSAAHKSPGFKGGQFGELHLRLSPRGPTTNWAVSQQGYKS